MSKYQACEKLEAIQDQSQAVGEFLEWLRDVKRLVLCEHGGDHQLTPAMRPTQELLADYFEIDLDAVEREKQHILTVIRRQHVLDDINKGKGA